MEERSRKTREFKASLVWVVFLDFMIKEKKTVEYWEAVWVGKCIPSVHRVLHLVPSTTQTSCDGIHLWSQNLGGGCMRIKSSKSSLTIKCVQDQSWLRETLSQKINIQQNKKQNQTNKHTKNKNRTIPRKEGRNDGRKRERILDLTCLVKS